MTADTPTILACSGGIAQGARTRWEFGGLYEYALELTGVSGRAPRICLLATAVGDSPFIVRTFYEAALVRGLQPSHLALFPMPNLPDPTAHLLEQDLVFVWGGSVAGLLAMWHLHGLGDAMRAAWRAGVVLAGSSAGSICWHAGGTTDSFGPELRAVTNGLGLIPLSNGVHYDSEPRRRPTYRALIADGTLGSGYATDDGVGLLYRGAEFAEAVSDQDGRGAYFVERDGSGGAVETRIDPRRL